MTTEPKVGIPTGQGGDVDRIDFTTPPERDVADIRDAIERKKRRENERDALRRARNESGGSAA
jgi:hypothetical protein